MADAAAPAGTLILLHGHDDDPAIFLSPARRMAPEGFAVIVPEGLVAAGGRASWWQNDDDGAADRAQVEASLAFVDETVTSAARTGTVVLVGFSQGAALALLWALRDGTDGATVDHVVAIAGWLPDVDGIALAPARCRASDVVVVVGEDDEVVAPPLSRSVARLLERHDVAVHRIERNVGHALEPFVDDVREWLTSRG